MRSWQGSSILRAVVSSSGRETFGYPGRYRHLTHQAAGTGMPAMAQRAPGWFVHSPNGCFSDTCFGPGTTVTGVGEPAVNKMGINFCLQRADILGSTEPAFMCGIYCPLIRGLAVCGYLLCAPGLQSELWTSYKKKVGAIILQELQIEVHGGDADRWRHQSLRVCPDWI